MPPILRLQPTRYIQANPLTSSTIRVCPECAGPVVQNCGCISCKLCGWGKCG